MNYKIWNKLDKINNMEAKYIIESLNIQENDGVFLILDDSQNVQCIEIDRIIKSVYKLDPSLSVEEVAQEYIKIKENEKLQAEKNISSLEEQEKKISILESNNKELREELSLTQDAVNEILFMMVNLKGE